LLTSQGIQDKLYKTEKIQQFKKYVVTLQILINLQKISYNKSLDGEGIWGDVPKKLGLGLQVLGTWKLANGDYYFTPSSF
jgi:hypothetical protein